MTYPPRRSARTSGSTGTVSAGAASPVVVSGGRSAVSRLARSPPAQAAASEHPTVRTASERARLAASLLVTGRRLYARGHLLSGLVARRTEPAQGGPFVNALTPPREGDA